jgi:hypothetical protein
MAPKPEPAWLVFTVGMALTILAAMTWALAAPSASPIYRPELFTKGTDMREHVLLFCLLGLVLTATIILVAAPGAVTWALALIE